jgi:hypothetical protein
LQEKVVKMQSESISAPSGALNVWVAVGNIQVPAGVQSLKKVKVVLSPDPGVAAAAPHTAPVFRLTGSGLLEQSPHIYLAQGHDCVLIAAATTLVSQEPDTQTYDVDIPVQTGGLIVVESMCVTEAMVGSMNCELDFSSEQAGGGNSMSDFVTAVMPAAAAVWVAVGNLQVPQLGEGKSPKKIKRIDCGFINDSAGGVTSLRTSIRFRLTGSGIAEGGLHHFLGNVNSSSGVAASTGGHDRMIKRHDCDVPVNPGGLVNVEAIFDVELPDAGDMIFGVQYA